MSRAKGVVTKLQTVELRQRQSPDPVVVIAQRIAEGPRGDIGREIHLVLSPADVRTLIEDLQAKLFTLMTDAVG